MTRILIFISGCVVFGLMFVIAQPWRDWGPEPPLPPLPRPDSVPVARLDPTLPPEIADAVQHATVLFEQDRASEALVLLHPFADLGFADVDALLGQIYLDEDSVHKDLAKAHLYLLSASEAGHGSSAYRLGVRLFEGDRFERDVERGLALLHKAADCGLPAASFRLGVIYFEGKHVPVDQDLGAFHMEFAAWASLASAQRNLGIFLIKKSRKVEGSVEASILYKEGVVWLLVAKDSGDPDILEVFEKHRESLEQSYQYDDLASEAIRRGEAILPADPYLCGFSHPMLHSLQDSSSRK